LASAPAGPVTGRRITLLTDFGTADGYVAAMKGVIASIAPYAIIDDAAHDIPPGDVDAASWALAGYWRLYPPDTVHVAVVDPGVGSSRRALAFEIDRRIIIVPDNGIITRVLMQSAPSRTVEIRSRSVIRADISATFHGRDVFAPAAGHVASGMPLEELGPPAGDPVVLKIAEPVHEGVSITGSIIHIDRFGNLVSNIPGDAIRGGHVALNGGSRISVRRTYSDADEGDCVALVGSRGFVEVAVRGGSAAELLSAGMGAVIVWSPTPQT
jgi:S-adenosylmethionine hydrolase